MRQQGWWRLMVGAALVGLPACEAEGPESSLSPAAAATQDLPIELYRAGGPGLGSPRGPCRGPGPHRHFDFWLGEWNVYNPAAAQIGTNFVTSELDGCVVEESWTDQGGGRGRSLNAWDAELGQWHQTWVAAALGRLRTSGGLVADTMILKGRRVTALGTELLDTWTWFAFTPDSVKQTGLVEVPAIGGMFPFTGIYVRSDNVTPAPETDAGNCQVGGAAEPTRWLDFWQGRWRVMVDHGRHQRRGAFHGGLSPFKTLGRSEVVTDLGGCLFEEHFSAARGYKATVWTYYDPTEGFWYRTYLDTEGEWIQLKGGVEDDALVLTGTEPTPGGEVEIQVRLAADGKDVVQTVTRSRDGAPFGPSVTLRYRQRGGPRS